MAHKLDVGKRRLKKFVSRVKRVPRPLPLVHSTDSYALADMLSTSSLIPQPCPVFAGEALLYFFYGRPAFRPNPEAEPQSLGHYFPVCLVFRPNWVPKIKRLFPFDSGGFQKGIYKPFLHPKMTLGDFSLEPNLSAARKLISYFFGNNGAYLQGTCLVTPKPDESEFEARSYLAILQAKGSDKMDSRGSAIEIQSNASVSLAKAVAAVALPASFMDGQVGRTLQRLGIDMLAYRTFERTRPTEYSTRIVELCIDYYVRSGVIDRNEI